MDRIAACIIPQMTDQVNDEASERWTDSAGRVLHPAIEIRQTLYEQKLQTLRAYSARPKYSVFVSESLHSH